MALPIVKVEGNVQWKVRQERDNWIAICDPLRLTLQSETYADLMEDIGLALDAMLRDLLESKDLERFLRGHGLRLAGAIPAQQAEVRFDVPFFLLPVNGSLGRWLIEERDDRARETAAAKARRQGKKERALRQGRTRP